MSEKVEVASSRASLVVYLYTWPRLAERHGDAWVENSSLRSAILRTRPYKQPDALDHKDVCIRQLLFKTEYIFRFPHQSSLNKYLLKGQ